MTDLSKIAFPEAFTVPFGRQSKKLWNALREENPNLLDYDVHWSEQNNFWTLTRDKKSSSYDDLQFFEHFKTAAYFPLANVIVGILRIASSVFLICVLAFQNLEVHGDYKKLSASLQCSYETDLEKIDEWHRKVITEFALHTLRGFLEVAAGPLLPIVDFSIQAANERAFDPIKA